MALTFLADELDGATGERWKELRERWIVRGGKGENLMRAVRDGPFVFKREEEDFGNLYVYHAKGA